MTAALRHEWVWLSDGEASASVWIPPGAEELNDDDEQAVEEVARRWNDAKHADAVLALVDRFDEHHPHDPPHYYLSLLATDPEQRGRGTGFALLADNLEMIDAEGAPAYLEASNAANVPLYRRYGYEPRAVFAVPGSPEVTTMWREARA